MTDRQITLDLLQQTGDLVAPIDPETLEAARQDRAALVDRKAADPRPLPQSGYTLWSEMIAATIQGEEIHAAIRVHGEVQRPGLRAESRATIINVTIPATVRRTEEPHE